MPISNFLSSIFPVRAGDQIFNAIIKVRLAHAIGGTVLLPDLIAIELDELRWFQPHFFSPCLLSFFDDYAYAQLTVDTDRGIRFLIGFTNDGLIRHLEDGSSLYRCLVSGVSEIRTSSTGACFLHSGNDLTVRLYHHTDDVAIEAIRKCGYFQGSKWNIQGTRRLENVEYVYFTSLPRIKDEDDLRRIGMASNGSITLIPTNARNDKDVLRITVYRESTLNRTSTIEVAVPADFIAPQHIWRHSPFREAVYYEISNPNILRVPLSPDSLLSMENGRLTAVGGGLKRFDYVVLGDANTPEGLVAPYDEENTAAIFKFERLGENDLFELWRGHPNSDQFSGRKIDTVKFQ